MTANSVTSKIAMTSSWTGLVLPKTAPNEMSTEPVQKSALIILNETEFNKIHYTQQIAQDMDKK